MEKNKSFWYKTTFFDYSEFDKQIIIRKFGLAGYGFYHILKQISGQKNTGISTEDIENINDIFDFDLTSELIDFLLRKNIFIKKDDFLFCLEIEETKQEISKSLHQRSEAGKASAEARKRKKIESVSGDNENPPKQQKKDTKTNYNIEINEKDLSEIIQNKNNSSDIFEIFQEIDVDFNLLTRWKNQSSAKAINLWAKIISDEKLLELFNSKSENPDIKAYIGKCISSGTGGLPPKWLLKEMENLTKKEDEKTVKEKIKPLNQIISLFKTRYGYNDYKGCIEYLITILIQTELRGDNKNKLKSLLPKADLDKYVIDYFKDPDYQQNILQTPCLRSWKEKGISNLLKYLQEKYYD